MVSNNLVKHNYTNDQNMYYLTLYKFMLLSVQYKQLGKPIYSFLMLSLTSSLMGQFGGEILKSKMLEANKNVVYQQKCRN